MDLLAGTADEILIPADGANADGADGDEACAGFFVTDEMILDFSERTRLEDVTDLVLRDMRISSMDQLDRLTALTTLSVAHNCLTRFDWKGGCANLTELNISRNKLVSLDGIEVLTHLRDLHAESNRLGCIAALHNLRRLKLLHLFNNCLDDFSACLVTFQRVQALPLLTDLEVANNPFCAKAEYRRTLIVRLRLHRLDGELLIRNLKAGTPAKPRPHADGAPPETMLHGPSARPQTAPSTRPQTAPALGTRASMGLFRDTTLDTNPILLEYLVDGACPPASEACTAAHSKKSFVGSLRSLATSMQHVSALTPSQVASLMAGDERGIEAIGASPHDVIRRLLKTVEVQQAELKRAHDAGHAVKRVPAEVEAEAEDATSEVTRLRNEVKRLEAENKSMWVLHEQNKMYKQQLSQTCERLADSVLLQDNECLRMQLKRLTDKYHALDERVRLGIGAPAGNDERPRTAEQIVQQFESYDAEIAALLKRNSLMFDEIKADLQATKRELSLSEHSERSGSAQAQPLAPVAPALASDPNRGKRGSAAEGARGGCTEPMPALGMVRPPSYARPLLGRTSPKGNKA